MSERKRNNEVQSKRAAVVTGCNRGLGLQIATQLAAGGYRVAAVCRKLKAAQSTAQLLGPDSCGIQLDLADGEPAVQAAAIAVAGWLGTSKLVLLINNAGNSYGDWDEESWAESRSVNFEGPCLLTEALIPSFAKHASVLMVGSGLGDLKLLSPQYRQLINDAKSIAELNRIAKRPVRQLAVERSWVGPYGLSKALVHRASQVFAIDSRFKAQEILVNSVCPGWVCTDMGGDQAPISVEEGARHILEKALQARPGVTGTFVCYCYKNYDDEHNLAWEKKHGSISSEELYPEKVNSHRCSPQSKKRRHTR